MSEAKFTKGPWIAADDNGVYPEMDPWSVDNDDCGTYSSVTVSSDDGVVCLVVTEGLDDTVMEANASLIACAPEMYEMLEKILGVYGMELFDCEDYDAIEALLAKARGENATPKP